MEELKEQVLRIKEVEIEKYTKKYGKFNSHHELWAVLQEEIEEVCDAVKEFSFTANRMKIDNMMSFEKVKKDEFRKLFNDYKNLHDSCLNFVSEGIQVLAVLGRGIDFLKSQFSDSEIYINEELTRLKEFLNNLNDKLTNNKE